MRRLAGVAAAAVVASVLAHCSASSRDGATTPDAAADASLVVSAGPSDASAPPDGGDGGADAAGAARDAGHCSPDHWCRVPLPEKDFDLTMVRAFSPTDAIAVGANGMIHWDGAAWHRVDDGDAGVVTGALSSIFARGSSEFWATVQGDRKLVHGARNADGGFDLTVDVADGGPTRDTVTGSPAGDLWITGIDDMGTPSIEHLVPADGGFVRESIAMDPPNFGPSGVFALSPNEAWVTGSTDEAAVMQLTRNADGGVSFTPSLSKTQDYFAAIDGTGGDDLWVLGATGNHFHRGRLGDGGLGWSPVPSHAAVALTSLFARARDDVWAVGYFGAVRHFDGKVWSVSQLAVNGTPIYDPLTSIHGSPAGDLWAVGPGIALHREVQP